MYNYKSEYLPEYLLGESDIFNAFYKDLTIMVIRGEKEENNIENATINIFIRDDELSLSNTKIRYYIRNIKEIYDEIRQRIQEIIERVIKEWNLK